MPAYITRHTNRHCKIRRPSLKKPTALGLVALFALELCLCPAIFGQESSPSEGEELDAVVVVGERVASERQEENPSKFVTVIEVKDPGSRVETVGEVLDETVGVNIISFGGMGGMATVSIRGASPSQVQVYVDGVPLNSPVSGATNLEDLPLDNVEYIEVFRGFVPPDFGHAGIGGAVNLVTRKGMEKSSAASFSYGSYRTYKGMAAASGPAGPLQVFVFGEYAESRGDFAYVNENGTPLNRGDDFTAYRVNNDFKAYDLTFRVYGEAGDWEITGVGVGHQKDQGLPGLDSNQAQDTRLETTRGVLNVSARNRYLFDSAVDLTVGADALRENQFYRDPGGELGAGGPRENENIVTSVGGRVKTEWARWDRGVVVTCYGEAREEAFLPVEHLPDREEGKRQRRVSLTGVAQVELTDPTGAFTLQASVRHERYMNHMEGNPFFGRADEDADNDDVLDLTSPSIGLIHRVSPHFILKANAGKFYRAPTFYELFGDRGIVVGNTRLDPEEGVNFDLGFVALSPGAGPATDVFVEYAFFQSRMDDLILFFQNSQRTVKPVNIGGAVIGGHELAFGLSLYDDFRLSGNYTFQSAVDKSEVAYWQNNALPFRPMHQAYGRLEYRPFEYFSVFADATYMSGNYWDRANLYLVPDRRIYNIGFKTAPYSTDAVTLTATVELKNLADERVADVAGYPLPGRSGYVTVMAKW